MVHIRKWFFFYHFLNFEHFDHPWRIMTVFCDLQQHMQHRTQPRIDRMRMQHTMIQNTIAASLLDWHVLLEKREPPSLALHSRSESVPQGWVSIQSQYLPFMSASLYPAVHSAALVAHPLKRPTFSSISDPYPPAFWTVWLLQHLAQAVPALPA